MIKNIIMAAAGGGSAPVVISTPSISVPVAGDYRCYGSMMILGTTYTLTSGGPDPLAGMQVQFSTNITMTNIVYDTGIVPVSSEMLDLSMSAIPDGSLYMRVRYKSTSGIFSNWSPYTHLVNITKVYAFTSGTDGGSVVVPAGKTQVTIKAWGSGSIGFQYGAINQNGSTGAYIEATVPVTAGENLYIVVGSSNGYGRGGWSNWRNSNRGGGLSGVFRGNYTGSVYSLTPIVIAGGAGGIANFEFEEDPGSNYVYGGNGGDSAQYTPNGSFYGGDATWLAGGGGAYQAGGGGGGGSVGGTGGGNYGAGGGGRSYVISGGTNINRISGQSNTSSPPNSGDSDYINLGSFPYLTPNQVGDFTYGRVCLIFS